jgi:hypothetical protein
MTIVVSGCVGGAPFSAEATGTAVASSAARTRADDAVADLQIAGGFRSYVAIPERECHNRCARMGTRVRGPTSVVTPLLLEAHIFRELGRSVTFFSRAHVVIEKNGQN